MGCPSSSSDVGKQGQASSFSQPKIYRIIILYIIYTGL